ncbi:hypothetical protein IW245_000701 [Longispora fulva]|uniref:Uncharacterized protein n=1 Tax=Longispora fulva TaxID=619741 RepID=A0A8J7KUV8_9ACTN|nr:hypothetical protein [Longispora fulva]
MTNVMDLDLADFANAVNSHAPTWATAAIT